MTLTRLRAPLGLIVLLVGTAFACSDSTGPTIDAVAGSYTATQFITIQNGTTTNQLARGVSIVLTLNEDGTTMGQFFAPNEVDANLAGTWSLDGSTVNLDHSADTFLRDIRLTVQGNQLVGDEIFGDEIFGDTRVRVTLTKQ